MGPSWGEGWGWGYVCPKSDFENLLFHMLRRKLCSFFVKHDHVKGTALSRATQIKRKLKQHLNIVFEFSSVQFSPSLVFFFSFGEERGEEECLIHFFFYEPPLPPTLKKIYISILVDLLSRCPTKYFGNQSGKLKNQHKLISVMRLYQLDFNFNIIIGHKNRNRKFKLGRVCSWGSVFMFHSNTIRKNRSPVYHQT